ncbi:hypothetical protein [Synechococcus sp. CCY 9618]|uniref:hypothetical protein n=1 Tax=Synechococcus sp. CCY 9618 TaxID=2815602 RepID=UPI001C22BCB4|nr:hypothetical protein [Synechococcus sp. CCY 9618]
MEEHHILPDSQVPPSVSYRQLAALLNQAPVEPEPHGTANMPVSAERLAFESLLAEWRRSSQQLLAALGRSSDDVVSEGRSPRQLMAMGALHAHLAMALQAHSAATGPQPD